MSFKATTIEDLFKKLSLPNGDVVGRSGITLNQLSCLASSLDTKSFQSLKDFLVTQSGAVESLKGLPRLPSIDSQSNIQSPTTGFDVQQELSLLTSHTEKLNILPEISIEVTAPDAPAILTLETLAKELDMPFLKDYQGIVTYEQLSKMSMAKLIALAIEREACLKIKKYFLAKEQANAALSVPVDTAVRKSTAKVSSHKMPSKQPSMKKSEDPDLAKSAPMLANLPIHKKQQSKEKLIQATSKSNEDSMKEKQQEIPQPKVSRSASQKDTLLSKAASNRLFETAQLQQLQTANEGAGVIGKSKPISKKSAVSTGNLSEDCLAEVPVQDSHLSSEPVTIDQINDLRVLFAALDHKKDSFDLASKRKTVVLETVQKIKVFQVMVRRQIPSNIHLLRNLNYVRLDGNKIVGTIPESIGNLVNVTKLDLSSNHLMGPIPDSISNLTQLNSLYLFSNELSGPIPASLGNLRYLTDLGLSENQLSGPIPETLSKLSNLYYLGLNQNNLVGQIPDWIGNFKKLAKLTLHQNQFEGTIPPSIGGLKELSRLNLSQNNLVGTIPDTFKDLKRLNILALSKNQLTGTIPLFLGKLFKLTHVNLVQNLFTGPIPESLGNLSHLEELNISLNHLSGPIPESLGDCVKLTKLYLFSNLLTGPIPHTLGNLVDLQELALSRNQLTGTIPWSFGNLVNLTYLDLHSNLLQESIPDFIGYKLLNLTQLRLDDNKLTGAIPASLANLKNLKELFLDGNLLIGQNTLFA